ncbi:hypothetical protein B0T10DRAFT_366958, partial [Thelonectria olida]
MEYFMHLPDFRLLACRECQTGVIRCRIKSHLRVAPHNLTKQEIEKTQQWATSLDIIDNETELKQLAFPADEIKPIGGLGEARTGGFRCTVETPESTCAFVGSELRRYREHLCLAHNGGTKLKAGRRSAAQAEAERANLPCRSGVYYQQFFKKGPCSQLFEVARGLDLVGSMAERQEAEVEVEEAMHAFQAKAKDLRKKEIDALEEQGDLAAPNAWLRRLGATTHLKDFSDK